jgi:hypothetical protein
LASKTFLPIVTAPLRRLRIVYLEKLKNFSCGGSHVDDKALMVLKVGENGKLSSAKAD